MLPLMFLSRSGTRVVLSPIQLTDIYVMMTVCPSGKENS